MFRVEAYRAADGKCPFEAWAESLAPVPARRIRVRIDRLADGCFGDHKLLPGAGGVRELRLDFGPGYRIYYGMDGDILVLLLCGGDKSSQRRDIAKAKELWKDYLSRRVVK